tara:strand:+ start:2571 stop:2753 length:183 start_codon:yes stop_codon:yes gene_type:complete
MATKIKWKDDEELVEVFESMGMHNIDEFVDGDYIKEDFYNDDGVQTLLEKGMSLAEIIRL